VLRRRQRDEILLVFNPDLYPPLQSILLKYLDGILMHLNPKQKAINILDTLLVKPAIKIKRFLYIMVRLFKSTKISMIA